MLVGRFFTTEPPGKPLLYKLNHRNCTSLLFFRKPVPHWQFPYRSPKIPASPASISLVKPSCVFLSMVKLGASFHPLMAAKMHGLIHRAWPFPCPGVPAQLLFADSLGWNQGASGSDCHHGCHQGSSFLTKLSVERVQGIDKPRGKNIIIHLHFV